MSEQYMASVIYLRLEELRSDVFWGWTKAKVDEIKDLFDEYLSTQAGERKDLFLKVAELEEKIRVLEGQVKFKDEEISGLDRCVANLKNDYSALRLLRNSEKKVLKSICEELWAQVGTKVEDE